MTGRLLRADKGGGRGACCTCSSSLFSLSPVASVGLGSRTSLSTPAPSSKTPLAFHGVPPVDDGGDSSAAEPALEPADGGKALAGRRRPCQRRPCAEAQPQRFVQASRGTVAWLLPGFRASAQSVGSHCVQVCVAMVRANRESAACGRESAACGRNAQLPVSRSFQAFPLVFTENDTPQARVNDT